MSLNQAAKIAKPPVYRIVLLQLLASFFLVGGWALFVNRGDAAAATAGALVNILPNLYFVRMAFRYQGARQADLVAKSFYRGEAGKFVTNLLLFVLVFTVWPGINVIALFAGYGLAQFAWWAGLAAGFDRRQPGKQVEKKI